MALTEADVQACLATVVDPNTGRDFVAGKSVKKITVTGADIAIELALGYPARSQHEALKKLVQHAVAALPGAGRVSVAITTRVVAHAVQRGVKLVPGVKNIVAVASGKGGVGKSTTAVNLALALAAEGATVGLLDADIYGPSLPMMLGIAGRPESADGKTLEPMEAYGLQAMSIGFLIDPDTPMVWRGPMVTQALEQLLKDTNWRELDFLVVDMPPGTGDIQLTLSQKVPVTGAVIVTTPQDIALLDARKGLKCARNAATPSTFSAKAARNGCARITACRSWAGCRSTSASASRPIPGAPPSWPTRTARSRRSTRKSRARWRFPSRRRRRISPPSSRASSSRRTRSRSIRGELH